MKTYISPSISIHQTCGRDALLTSVSSQPLDGTSFGGGSNGENLDLDIKGYQGFDNIWDED